MAPKRTHHLAVSVTLGRFVRRDYAHLTRLDNDHPITLAAKTERTRDSAMAEGPREALVSRNPATTKHLT